MDVVEFAASAGCRVEMDNERVRLLAWLAQTLIKGRRGVARGPRRAPVASTLLARRLLSAPRSAGPT